MLRDRGYECVPQVGVAGFFIDIGVRDPHNGGRFVLGIECDGSTYHSSKAARDRDRLRDEVLTRLGWRLHRVWSTDWFSEPHRQIERIVLAINEKSGSQAAAGEPAVGHSATLLGASVGTQVKVATDPVLKTEKATSVDDLLLESDILEALRTILPSGTSLEREKLLRSLAAAVKKPLNRKLRSAFNTMISREVKSGHLVVAIGNVNAPGLR
jgi:very-short-patch-repair endonuclease